MNERTLFEYAMVLFLLSRKYCWKQAWKNTYENQNKQRDCDYTVQKLRLPLLYWISHWMCVLSINISSIVNGGTYYILSEWMRWNLCLYIYHLNHHYHRHEYWSACCITYKISTPYDWCQPMCILVVLRAQIAKPLGNKIAAKKVELGQGQGHFAYTFLKPFDFIPLSLSIPRSVHLLLPISHCFLRKMRCKIDCHHVINHY